MDFVEVVAAIGFGVGLGIVLGVVILGAIAIALLIASASLDKEEEAP